MHLTELIESYFADYRTHGSKDNEILLLCPFCAENGHIDEARHTLGVNTTKEIGHCHRCDWKGAGKYLFDSLADHCSSTDIYETDASAHHLVEQTKKVAKLQRIALPKTYEPLWVVYQDIIGKEALSYVLKRGITEQQIRKHRIGFCAVGSYVDRIIFPVFYKKWVVGFTARTFRNGEPKYLNSPGERFIYNYPRQDSRRKSRCILVEGPIDALSIEQVCSSEYDCLGKFGSSLTPIQIKALGKYKEIVLWPDPDQAGIVGIIKVAKILKENTESLINCIVPARDMEYDPGAMEKQEIEEALGTIRPWTSDLINKMLVRVLF